MTGEQFLNSIRGLDLEITAMDDERCRIADRRRDLLEKAESLGAGLTGSAARRRAWVCSLRT